MEGAYKKLLLMLAISFVIMYSVMFLNVAQYEHIYLSLTRTYMSLLMVLPMAMLMLLMMPKMFSDKKMNLTIHGISVVMFMVVVVLLRTQTPIDDEQYMKAMIPHHSSAIMTSEQANIQDPEVKNLSLQIIEAQQEEIAQMKAILRRLESER